MYLYEKEQADFSLVGNDAGHEIADKNEGCDSGGQYPESKSFNRGRSFLIARSCSTMQT